MKTSRLPSSSAAATSRNCAPASSFIFHPSSFPPRRLLLLAGFSLSAFQLFSLSAAAASAAAAPTPVTATISAVTVYADRAVVTRRAQLELPAGASELVFEKLPDSLVDASLQVAGRGPANATIIDVGAHLTYVDASPDPREKTLDDALVELRKQDRAFADQLAALAHQTALLGQIETLALTPAPATTATPAAPRLAFDEWQKLLTFSDANATRLAAAQRDLEKQRALLGTQITAQESSLRDLRGNRPARKSYKTVTVRLFAAQAGALDLTLASALPNASWTPVYDARLHTDSKVPTVELAYFGHVRNATGEDWPEVALTLSTARPSLGGGSVEPTPWILEVARPNTVQYFNRGQAMQPLGLAQNGGLFNNTYAENNNYAAVNVASNIAINSSAAVNTAPLTNIRGIDTNNEALAPGSPGTAAADPSLAGWSTAAVDLGTTSATFKIPDPVTLPGDNTPRRVAILSTQLPAQLQYQAVPRLAETAFLSAYITNTTDYPLLTGALNVFLDDNFVSTGRLALTTMPGERFQLALGADEGIAIKRTLVPSYNQDTGLTGKYHLVTYEYNITVTNNKKSRQRVMFKEVIPVSRDEKIVVKLLEPAARDVLEPKDVIVPGQLPKAGITREEDGRLVFRADIEPGKAAARTFKLKFTVEFPNDVPVAGLQ